MWRALNHYLVLSAVDVVGEGQLTHRKLAQYQRRDRRYDPRDNADRQFARNQAGEECLLMQRSIKQSRCFNSRMNRQIKLNRCFDTHPCSAHLTNAGLVLCLQLLSTPSKPFVLLLSRAPTHMPFVVLPTLVSQQLAGPACHKQPVGAVVCQCPRALNRLEQPDGHHPLRTYDYKMRCIASMRTHRCRAGKALRAPSQHDAACPSHTCLLSFFTTATLKERIAAKRDSQN